MADPIKPEIIGTFWLPERMSLPVKYPTDQWPMAVTACITRLSMVTRHIAAGTGSGRAVVFDHSGRHCGLGQVEWTHVDEPDVPGSMAFDTGANWAMLCRRIRQALARADIRDNQIGAISTTSMSQAPGV